MKRWHNFIWLLSLFASTFPGLGAGLILVHEPGFWDPHFPMPEPPRPPRPFPPPRPIPPFPPTPPPPPNYAPPRPISFAPLEVVFDQVNVRIKDQIASTSIDQEFYNPNDRQLEGTFLFPVPKGTHLDKFTMEIGGKPVEAELLAADKARRIYEDIVRKLRDPALLEYAGRDLFKVRIFPIEPHSRKRVKLAYSQLLKSDAGWFSYVLPLNTEKFSAKPLKTLSVRIDLASKRALKSIYSPSHPVEVRRRGDHEATIGFEASNVKPDTDFQVYFTCEEGDVGLGLLTHKSEGEDGYFLLLASPAVDLKHEKVGLKDVAFVLDTSGSMAGKKLDQAKKALQFCVANLNDGDRFEIMRFATEIEPLFNQLTVASNASRSRADEFIQGLKPIGGTAIDEALRKALAIRPEKTDRPFVIIFLTDGLPTVGIRDEDQIVAGVNQRSGGNTRVFCFGIGTDVNTHLLDKITEATRAFSQYVLPDEDIEVKVSAFFTKIKEPVLADLKLAFPDGARVSRLYPAPLPDLYKGEQIVLAGRYSGKASGKITLTGTVNGATKNFNYDGAFPGDAADHDFIPRLWATRRVGHLLDEIRLHGDNQELKDEVSELARRHGIVTPYTAYLILEDEDRRNVARSVRSLPGLDEGTVRLESRDLYRGLQTDRVGGGAVASAQMNYRLKAADNAAQAISQGNDILLRQRYGLGPAQAGASPALPTSPMRGAAGEARIAAESSVLSKVTHQAQQTRHVNGRAFYQNGNQWIDATVQKMTNAKPVRIQFNSAEYFDLLAQQPKAQSWLALGQNVQFVLGKTVYEIYDDSPGQNTAN